MTKLPRRNDWLALLIGFGLIAVAAPVFAGDSADDSDTSRESTTSKEREKEKEKKKEKEKEGGESGQSRTPAEKKAMKHLEKAREAYHDGKWFEARRAYRDAYDASPASSPVRVESSLGRSTLLWEQGEYTEARRYIDHALALARKLDRQDAVGRLLLTLGHIEASEGDLSGAESTLQQCVKLAAAQKDPVFGPLCQLNRRLVRKLQGKSAGGEASFRKAVDKLQSVDSKLTVGLSLAKTAELYAKGGEHEHAFDLVSRAGEKYEQAGSVPAKARNRVMKARLLQQSGRWQEARVELDGLAATFQKMGSKPALVDVYGLLGNDARHRGAYDEATSYYRKGLKAAKGTESPQLLAKSKLALCETGAASGRAGLKTHCEAAARTFSETGMPLLEARSRAAHARIMQETGDLEEARQAFVDAIQLLEDEVHASLLSGEVERAYANLCQVEARLEVEGAQYRCNEALDKLKASEEAGTPAMRAATHYALGNAAARAGDTSSASEHLETAASMYLEDVKPADVRMYADTQLRIGAMYKKLEKPERAAKAFRNGLDELEETDGSLGARIRLRTQFAQMELQRENWEGARAELTTLAEEAKEAGEVSTRAWAFSARARAQSNLEDQEGAKASLEKALELAKRAGDDDLVETVEGNLERFE